MFIDVQWTFIGFHWFSMIVIDFHWCPLIFNGFQWFHWVSLIFKDFYWIWIFNDYHWFYWILMIFNDCHWFSLIFKGNGASVGQPSAPWGWVFYDEKLVFRVGPSKTGPVSRPPRRPSAPLRPPSATIGSLWVGVKVGYGSPPSNSPRHSICICKRRLYV